MPGPVASGSYVDCRALGHTVTASDPASDLQTLYHPELAAQFASADLTRVQVGVDGSRLCVDFTAKAPPTSRTFYIFRVVEPGTTTGGPAVGIDLIFWPNGARQVALKYPGDDEAPYGGIVPAQAGVTADSTSLVIDRSVLPPWTSFPRFWWTAEGVGQTGLRTVQQVSDTDPASTYGTYP